MIAGRHCASPVLGLLAVLTLAAHGGCWNNSSREQTCPDDKVYLLQSKTSISRRNAQDLTHSHGQDFSTNTAPGVDPLQFLIISSPTQKKVAWTTLQNFASSDGRAFPLVSSGLDQPRGLAIDHANSWLYIADSGAEKIFRYTILTDMTAGKQTLVTSGTRITVSQGHPVEWLTLDKDGNMFYTAPDTNNINKIPAVTLAKIGEGEARAADLVIVSERTLEDKSMLKSTMPQIAQNALQQGVMLADKPPEPPNIYSFYEASINPHVSMPASILADGADLYWTNGQAGKTAGTVVKGKTNPGSHIGFHGSAPFPAAAITNVSKGAFGLAKTNKFMFFSQSGPAPRSGLVTGLILGTNIAVDVTSRLVRPRGLAWDQDQTVYVADEDEGTVWSFPAGRLTANMPLTRTVHVDGAYGMAIFSSKDPGFSANQRGVDRPTFNEESSTMMNTLEQVIFLQTGRTYFGFKSASRRAQGRICTSTLLLVAAVACMCALMD